MRLVSQPGRASSDSEVESAEGQSQARTKAGAQWTDVFRWHAYFTELVAGRESAFGWVVASAELLISFDRTDALGQPFVGIEILRHDQVVVIACTDALPGR